MVDQEPKPRAQVDMKGNHIGCFIMKVQILSVVLAAVPVLCGLGQSVPDVVWEASLNYGYVVTDVAVSRGNDHVACPQNGSVAVRRISDGSSVTNLILGGTWVSGLCFSGDGRFLAGAGSSSVRVWNLADWSTAYSVAGSGPITFSPDSTMLATAANQVIQLRKATNGVLLHSWTNLSTTFWGIVALAFSPDGTMLASGAGMRGFDTSLSIWSVPSGNLLKTVPTAQTYHVGDIAFSPDGQWVATAGGQYAYGPAQLWRVSDWQLMQTFPGGAFSARFSPDGAMLAVIGSNIDFYRVPDGKLLQHYSDSANGSYYQKALAFTPNGDSFLRVCYPEIFRARTPLIIHEFERKNSKWHISWVGGHPPFRIQERTNLLQGPWQDLDAPSTNRTRELEPRTSNGFYRVISGSQ